MSGGVSNEGDGIKKRLASGFPLFVLLLLLFFIRALEFKEKLYIRGLYYENIQFFSFHPKQDEAHPGYGAAHDVERRGE